MPLLLLLPNLVTILGLCAGLTSIRFTLDERFDWAAGLIVFAALIDGLDGLLARRLNATSPMGAELDSLSDFVCFGVAPGLLMYHFSVQALNGAGWSAVLVFIICCCLRLARFNVARDDPPPVGRAHFLGVPAPAGALLALLPVFAALGGLVDLSVLPVLMALWLVLIGGLMISRLRTISIKNLRVRRDLAGFMLLALALLVGVLFTQFWLAVTALVSVYAGFVVHAGVLAWRGRAAGHPAGTGETGGAEADGDEPDGDDPDEAARGQGDVAPPPAGDGHGARPKGRTNDARAGHAGRAERENRDGT